MAAKKLCLLLNKLHLDLIFSLAYQYSETNEMHFLLNLLRIIASIYFEHYLLILGSPCTNGTWYIACVLCQLAAPLNDILNCVDCFFYVINRKHVT
jgi:hypothetical protein